MSICSKAAERPKAAREGGGRAAGGREDASERAKRVSEPTRVGCQDHIGWSRDMITTHGEGERSEPDASERAQRVSEPPCCG